MGRTLSPPVKNWKVMEKEKTEVTSEFQIHRRRLPHWQIGGSTYFVTFRSAIGILPEKALKIVKHHVLFDHTRRYELLFGVIMPDHIHLLIRPLEKEKGVWYNLGEIMKGIKGSSATNINRLMGRAGRLWQDEFFDRIVRDEKEMLEKWEYIWNNPLKAGLANSTNEYQFYVRPEENENFSK